MIIMACGTGLCLVLGGIALLTGGLAWLKGCGHEEEHCSIESDRGAP